MLRFFCQPHYLAGALAFGGAIAPDNTVNANIGNQIASQVNTFVLAMLGKQEHFIFTQDTVYASYHDRRKPLWHR